MPIELPKLTRKRKFRHVLRAQLRDGLVLLQESKNGLLLFSATLLVGALLFFFFYTDPHTGERLSLAQAFYGTFALIFFENTIDFPRQWYLQILYFLLPVIGLVAIADGLISFGAALINKRERGNKWQVAMASTYNGHTIICGMGKVGYRVAVELLKFEREIVAIEVDPQGRFVEKAKNLGIPVIIADARRSENLRKAGIEQADAIIPCTDDELTNLDIALDAREINPGVKIVMRMFDPDLAQRIEKGFGIHTAFSVSALAAPIFAAASMRVNVKASFYVNDTLMNISEQVIGPASPILDWTVERLESELDLSVVSYTRDDRLELHPPASLRLESGSRLMVMGTLEALHRLEALIHPRNPK